MRERLIVIEQPAELKIAHPNAVRWEAVAAIPGQVAVTPSQLVAAALRHRPDRIIMGEIRDECGYDLLQAMNTGHGGTLSTLHADSRSGRAGPAGGYGAQRQDQSQSAIHPVTDRKGSGFCSLLRTRFHGPAPSARADHREGLQPRGPVLRDRGTLSGFLCGGGVNSARIARMETRIGGTAMKSLLGHGEANEISPLLCALERDHAEQKTCDAGCEMRLFVQRSGARSGSGLPVKWHRQEARRLHCSDVCLPVPFLTCSVTASGPLRRPAASSLFCFPTAHPLRVTVSICDGPSVNAELRPWESRPLA